MTPVITIPLALVAAFCGGAALTAGLLKGPGIVIAPLVAFSFIAAGFSIVGATHD